MRPLHIFTLLILFISITSCSTVRVSSDYDKDVSFQEHKTYAFFKPGIDKAEISDLDKRRILRAIDQSLQAKSMQKSENPDVLISIFTKAEQRVDIYRSHYGWGSPWGWGWGNPMGYSHVSKTTEGSLYIDIIDAKTNSLIWQGLGTAPLVNTSNIDKKEERIQLIVSEILKSFPPDKK